jgi:ATPase family associated with various cellular activities (AAA)
METITLPDLENAADVEIVRENVIATGAIYSAYLLEEARAFQVVDRIAELFAQGLLPLGRGRAAEALRRYWRSGNRISERERRELYARVLGLPGGAAAVRPNGEFPALWLRFVDSVSAYARKNNASGLVQPPSANNAGVRKAARDLAANASLHGSGIAGAAARRLVAQARQLFEILNDCELQAAFGARDAWQVIERVSRDLGGARNVARYRKQAEAARQIFDWLADHTAGVGRNDDAQVVSAAEQWLGTADVMRIDLAAVTSKYIGETEKNLSALFSAAEKAGAVLLFGEGDALFGGRTEVKDSHDRYANIDVTALLKRIEGYVGIVVVASNRDEGEP